MKEILESIKKLTLAEKDELYRTLRLMIAQERKEDVSELLIEHYKKKICSIMGLQSYEPKSRERVQVIARTIIANILLNMGYSTIQIGLAIGKDHSTILHYRDIYVSWIDSPRLFKEELKYLEKVFKEL